MRRPAFSVLAAAALLTGLSVPPSAGGEEGKRREKVQWTEIVVRIPDFAELERANKESEEEYRARMEALAPPYTAEVWLPREQPICDRAMTEVEAQFDEILNALIRQFYTETTPTVRTYLAYLLRCCPMRFRGATTETLLRGIDAKAPWPSDPFSYGTPRWYTEYPVMEAIADIGSAWGICEHLADETNDLRRDLMCRVIKRVKGEEDGRKMIEKRLAEAKNETQRQNLQAALKCFPPAAPSRSCLSGWPLAAACAGSFVLGLTAMALFFWLRRLRET